MMLNWAINKVLLSRENATHLIFSLFWTILCKPWRWFLWENPIEHAECQVCTLWQAAWTQNSKGKLNVDAHHPKYKHKEHFSET